MIGAGIYGCTLALEAARRGLRPLLLERDDFGQHTSGSWLRIVHGGLRYLQKLDLRRHLESVRERRWFLRHFPESIEPLPCLMPLYGRGLRRRPVVNAALAINDALSSGRNTGVRPDRHLPPGRVVAADEVRRIAPSISTPELSGGALWYDAVSPAPQRLLMEVLRWAAAEGALVANRVEVERIVERDGEVRGVRARDLVTGRELAFRSRAVVSCGGPWTPGLAERFDRPVPELFRPSMAFNIFLDREPDFRAALAVTARAAGARTYFLLPAHGGVLAGTYHAALPEAGPISAPTSELVADFARELDEAVPGLALGSAKVRHVFWGQLPVRSTGTVDLAGREVIHDHGRRGGPNGLFTVSGVKFTVARAVAERTLSALERGRHIPRRAHVGDLPPAPRGVPDAAALLELAGRDRAAAVESIRRLADEEAALEPDDVLWRRTTWALDEGSGDLLELIQQALAARDEARP